MLSIIIPIIRQKRVKACLESIGLGYEIITEVDAFRIGCPKMVKQLVAKTSNDLVCFLGDDTILHKNCLKNALAKMATFAGGWGLVGLNDGIHKGTPATHWIASKRLLPLLGGEFFHTGYRHCRCDVELTKRCQALGRYKWAENARLTHNHPVVDKKYNDRDYENAYSEENLNHDFLLYAKRRANGWR